jgi:transcriptional regulator with XRE-family HTH domain
MLERLGRAAREARQRKGCTQLDVASAAGVSNAVISRFETGIRWPQDPDAVTAAYETECGLKRFELWRRALSMD